MNLHGAHRGQVVPNKRLAKCRGRERDLNMECPWLPRKGCGQNLAHPLDRNTQTRPVEQAAAHIGAETTTSRKDTGSGHDSS